MAENFGNSARKFCRIAGTFRNVPFPSRNRKIFITVFELNVGCYGSMEIVEITKDREIEKLFQPSRIFFFAFTRTIASYILNFHKKNIS